MTPNCHHHHACLQCPKSDTAIQASLGLKDAGISYIFPGTTLNQKQQAIKQIQDLKRASNNLNKTENSQ